MDKINAVDPPPQKCGLRLLENTYPNTTPHSMALAYRSTFEKKREIMGTALLSIVGLEGTHQLIKT